MTQTHHLFVLFQQHRQQEDIKRQCVPGISCGSQVLPRRGEEIIQGNLIAAPQGAPETRERFLLLQESLCNRR
jgi:hypothetical protein